MSERNDAINSMRPGDWLKIEGEWYVKPPPHSVTGAQPPPGSVANHTVTEHDDGTITVDPSISITWYSYQLGEETTWHGHLKQGVWTEC